MDRPDIVNRVFRQMYSHLLTQGLPRLFGAIDYYMFVIEFQGRGTPHMHLLFRLEEEISSLEDVEK